MSPRSLIPALAIWLAVASARAAEAPDPAPPEEAEATAEEPTAEEPTAEEVPPAEETAPGEGPDAPPEETAAAAEGDGETGAGEDVPPDSKPPEDGVGEGKPGESTADGRPSGAELVDKLRERAISAPPTPGEERLDRAAKTASRIIRPLPQPFAVAATVVGFILMLFGQRLFRTGIVLYFMALVGMVGREMGAQFNDSTGPLVGGCAGCLIGAGVALPLRALVRALVGGLTGGIVASILVQSFTSDLVVTLVMVAVGIAASGLLTFFFPKPLLVIGFALFGAVTASIGILSFATEPVMINNSPRLSYLPEHIVGVVLATALGILFQSHLGPAEEEDD